MKTCKTKAILAYLRIFWYNRAYSSIIRDFQELFRHIQNPVQLWYIQNVHIFSTSGIFRALSKIRNNGQNYANYSYYHNISFSRSLLYEDINQYHEFFNVDRIFTLQYLLYVKKYGGRGGWAVNYDIHVLHKVCCMILWNTFLVPE